MGILGPEELLGDVSGVATADALTPAYDTKQ